MADFVVFIKNTRSQAENTEFPEKLAICGGAMNRNKRAQ